MVHYRSISCLLFLFRSICPILWQEKFKRRVIIILLRDRIKKPLRSKPSREGKNLIRLFKRAIGLNPLCYVIGHRVCKASLTWEFVPLRESQFLRKRTWNSRENFKTVLMFKHFRYNTFPLNDTLCFELKGTAKLVGVVFHTFFLSRFKAIIPQKTTDRRAHCLVPLNKEQFGCFEPLYRTICCKSMTFWRQRLEIAPIIK